MEYKMEDFQRAYDNLVRKQSIKQSVLGAVIGSLFALAFYGLLSYMQSI